MVAVWMLALSRRLLEVFLGRRTESLLLVAVQLIAEG
jgi:hypothetical protein